MKYVYLIAKYWTTYVNGRIRTESQVLRVPMCCFATYKPAISSKTVTWKRMKYNSYLRPYINNSKLNKILKIRVKNLKLLRENKCKSSLPYICQWFLRSDTKHTNEKGKKIRQFKLHKNKKNFCASKDTIKWVNNP